MNTKERVVSSIKFKSVDKIPTMYRAINFLSRKLFKHFNIGMQDAPGLFVKNYKKLMEALGIDLWSSGSNIGKFLTFIPAYKGPELAFMDNNYYSAIGIPTKPKSIPEYEYTFTEIIKNPLGNITSTSDVKGFLTKKLDCFDYQNLVNNVMNLESSSILNGKIDKNQGLNTESKIRKENIGDLSIESLKSQGEVFICMGNVLSNPFMLCSYLRGMDTFLMDLAGNKRIEC